MVQIVVGKDVEKTFYVHKGLLSHYSEHFANMFNAPTGIEAHSGIARLDEDNPETFQLFYNFIYTGRIADCVKINSDIQYSIENHRRTMPIKLYLSDQAQEHAQARPEGSVPLSFEQLFDLAIFADTYSIPVISDTIISLVCDKICTEMRIPADQLQYLQENLSRKSKLLELLTIMLAFCVDMQSIGTYRDCIPRAMMANMFYYHRYMYANSHKGDAPDGDQEMNACHWHSCCKLKVS